jgi:hypothetical protein
MTIRRRWWDPVYPWSVAWEDAYRLHHTQAVWGSLEDHVEQGSYYVMRTRVQHFLEDLPPTRFLGIKKPGCRYVYHTPRQPFLAQVRHGTVRLVPPPPELHMARKADALMLKLACHGS